MCGKTPGPIIRNSKKVRPTPGSRAGITERWLLTPDDSEQQNILLVKTEEGSMIGYHEIGTSESIFVLEGEFEILFDDPGEENFQKAMKQIGPGDLCYFEADSGQAIRCTQGPGRFLIVFAPSKKTL
jgi:hypothetical protein